MSAPSRTTGGYGEKSTDEVKANFLAGVYDFLPVTKAFARHRIATRQSDAARIAEAVAKLRDAKTLLYRQTEKVESRIDAAISILTALAARQEPRDAE